MTTMNATRWAAAAVAAVTIASPAASAPSSRRCAAPKPTLTYSAERVSVRLTVDYTGCTWWRGGDVGLSGVLRRRLPQGPTLGWVVSARDCMARASGTAGIRSCSITLTMPHEQVEASTYSGEIRFPWRNGPRDVVFSYECTSTPLGASCE